jgi:hypothetical protein
MDLGGWLRSLGLEKYEAVLRDNEIDDAVLPKLTEDHLRELGFPLGARLKLLDAIAALAPRIPADEAPIQPSPSAPPPTSAAAEAAGERRQLTVMFCDLVGSTALSAKLDPEDLRAIIGAYHRCCTEVITKSGGFVAKYMGDGVLALPSGLCARDWHWSRLSRSSMARGQRCSRCGLGLPPVWWWWATSLVRARHKSKRSSARRPILLLVFRRWLSRRPW